MHIICVLNVKLESNIDPWCDSPLPVKGLSFGGIREQKQKVNQPHDVQSGGAPGAPQRNGKNEVPEQEEQIEGTFRIPWYTLSGIIQLVFL